MYQDLFEPLEEACSRSALVQLIQQYRPNVIMDCINTTTAISYQDIDSISQKISDILQELRQIIDHQDLTSLENLGKAFS